MKLGVLLLSIVISVAIDLFIAWILMLLWNAIIPSIFEIRTIDYWESVTIVVLFSVIKMIFK